MSGIAAAIIGSGVIGAGASIFGAMAQTNASKNAIAAQQGMFNQAVGYASPFISAGQSALPTLEGLITPGANQTALLKQTPGYQFANDVSQQSVSNQGTVTGLGGNTLLAGSNAATQLALGMAWQPTVNALQGLVSTGSNNAAALGGQAVQTGANIGNSLTGIGNAQAGAATSVGANLGNSLTSAALFNKLLGNNMYETAADAGKGGPSAIGTGNYNFLDAQA
jgi:hypothetical protein